MSDATEEQFIRKVCEESTLATMSIIAQWIETLDDKDLTIMGGVFQRIWLERFDGASKQ